MNERYRCFRCNATFPYKLNRYSIWNSICRQCIDEMEIGF